MSLVSFLIGLFVGGTFGLVLFSLLNISKLSDDVYKNVDKDVDCEDDKK